MCSERTRDNGGEQDMRERERERERYLISFSCQFLILNNLLKEPLVPAIDTAAQCAGWENKRECVCVCVCVCVFGLVLDFHPKSLSSSKV